MTAPSTPVVSTDRDIGRVTDVTCQALPTLEAWLSGREGSVQCWRCFHGGAEVLWEREL